MVVGLERGEGEREEGVERWGAVSERDRDRIKPLPRFFFVGGAQRRFRRSTHILEVHAVSGDSFFKYI